MATENYGVGPGATKMNVGPNHSVVARMEADGSVIVEGATVYDPAEHGLNIQQADPERDYADGIGLPENED